MSLSSHPFLLVLLAMPVLLGLAGCALRPGPAPSPLPFDDPYAALPLPVTPPPVSLNGVSCQAGFGLVPPATTPGGLLIVTEVSSNQVLRRLQLFQINPTQTPSATVPLSAALVSFAPAPDGRTLLVTDGLGNAYRADPVSGTVFSTP